MLFAVNVLAPQMDRENTGKRKSIADEPSYGARPRRRADETSSVLLIRKYAEMIDGVNLEEAEVGDRLELSRRDADVLIAEGWAERAADERRVRPLPGRALAADNTRRRKRKS
jgi:hypothetical protein